MPFPNFHSCRLEDPKKYDTCRRGERIADKPDSVKGKKFYVIYCKKTGGSMEQQSFRYPKETWKASQAEAHCKYNKGSFEAAAESKSNPNILEERSCSDYELRAVGDDKPRLEGYAAVFGQLSENLGGFVEKIKRGAFEKSLREKDVKFLFNHDPNYVIARKGNKTLRLLENTKGLFFDADPVDTQWARDLLVSIGREDIYQNSFRFRTIKDSWDKSDPKLPVRTLIEVELADISVCTFPGYTQTIVNVRSEQDVYNDYVNELQENELAEITDELRQERLSQLRKINIEIKNKEIKKWKN